MAITVSPSSINTSDHTNVATSVGIEVVSAERSGTKVTIKWRAWIKNTSTYWSNNSMCLWLNGTKYFAHNNSSGGTNHWNEGAVSYAPSSTGTVTTEVTLGTTVSETTLQVGVNGALYNPGSVTASYNGITGGYETFTVKGLPTINPPTLSSLSTSDLGETSVKASFSVTNDGGEAVSDSYIDIFTDSGLTNKVGTISSASGTFTGLDAGRSYWIRGNAANSAGRVYTNTVSITTSWTNPGAPSGLSITSQYGADNLYYGNYTLKWNAGSAGSTAVAGYRLRIYKNGTEVAMIDTESTATSYTFNATTYNFAIGDTLSFGLYTYSKNYSGEKKFNGGGSSSAQVKSGTVTMSADKFISVSQNGGQFKKCRVWVSINGGSFQEVRRTKFKVL